MYFTSAIGDNHNSQLTAHNISQPVGLYIAIAMSDPTKAIISSVTEDDLYVRTATPLDINQRCLSLCQAFIGGIWCNATSSRDISVKRLTGGLTNQMYRVQLMSSTGGGDDVLKKENSAEPTDVTIKLFDTKVFKRQEANERLDDVVILATLSALNIGPRVFGIAEEAIIQEFIEHEHFRPKHQQDTELVANLAQLLARTHHLDVPIRKDTTWPISEIAAMISTKAEQLIDKPKLFKQIEELNDEFTQLKMHLNKVNSPIVFSHNDFIGTNILVTPARKLLLIDYEYSGYFARAFDLAMFFSQWGHEPDDYEHLELPDDLILLNFIELYIEGCEKCTPGYTQKEENNSKNILREVKLYMLVYLFYLMAFMMTTEESPGSNMEHIQIEFRRYREVKEKLINDGTIVA